MSLEKNGTEYNFNVVQGDTFKVNISYTDSSNLPINLSNYSAWLEIRDKPGGKILCATASVNDGITIVSASGGINVSLSSAKTKNFTTPRAAYQLQITDYYGAKTTLLNGWFLVNPGVIN